MKIVWSEDASDQYESWAERPTARSSGGSIFFIGDITREDDGGIGKPQNGSGANLLFRLLVPTHQRRAPASSTSSTLKRTACSIAACPLPLLPST